MRSPAHRLTLAVILAVAVTGCTSDTTVPTVDDFLPTVSNLWKNAANQAHTFQLNSADDGEPTGVFDGTESHPTLGESDVEGTWTNSVAQLTIKRATGNLVYEGKFLAQDTLRLTLGQETILLGRQTF
jgi:hypothetical protein